jgi:O-antigen ligase
MPETQPVRPPSQVGRMAARLAAAPVTVPALVAVAIFLVWVPHDAGQSLTRWAPGTLAILALLAVTAVALPRRWADIPGAVRSATLLLAGFTAWSFASVAWADDQGAALEGADRTLLYFAVFALFALWPQRAGTAAWILGAWTLGLGVLAVVTLLHLSGAADPSTLFSYDRLADPAGYANAAAALWLMPLWPAITLAASARVPWPLRALFAALAVVLADVALLSQSRGSVLSMPVVALVFVAFVPGRLRHLAVLVPIAAAAGAAAPTILDVGPAIVTHDTAAMRDAVHAAARAVLVAAAAAGLVVGVAAALESLRPLPAATAQRVRRGWTAIVVAGAAVLVVGGLAVTGNPITRIDDGWSSFKGGYDDNAGGNRLTSGLGSNRYDFYRVALDRFSAHPIGGIGADNFFEDYLADGDSSETPSYPHNLALRTLSQTGIVGMLLLLGAVGAALAAAWRAMRDRDPLAATVAGGAAMAFVYWVAHGMTDWFWEWAGLGAPAFALLGLACALAPRRSAASAPAPGSPAADDDDASATATAPPAARRPRRAAARRAGLALGAVALLAGALAVAGPWLAERDVERAGAVFARKPFEAYDRLDRAARLDPVSDRPALVKGSIALRYGDLPRAQAAFSDALQRNPRGQYATLELGAIASARGDRVRARRLLTRAVALAPRDGIAREALRVVTSGGAVDLAALNRRILAVGQSLSDA